MLNHKGETMKKLLSSFTRRVVGAVALALASVSTVSGQGVNVVLRSHLDQYVSYSNIWGYTAPDGREYALLGATTGLSVVNLEDPSNPYETGFIPGPTSSWRELKTFSHYCYVVSEGGGGMQIIDLIDPENPVQLASYNGFITAHTISVDEATSRCYINGSNLGSGGIRVLSLANPVAPVEVGNWEVRYCHDSYRKGTRLYAANIFDSRLDILNVTTDTPAVAPLATVSGYPSAFTHNAWTTQDGTHVMTTDETAGSSVRLWNVQNLASIVQTDAYRATPTASIPHNVHIDDGELAYISHYTLGVKIVDVTNRSNVVEVGSYDTYAPSDSDAFEGAWGVFPYFGTNPGLFVVSDISGGLYVLEFSQTLGTLQGTVVDALTPSSVIPGATVQIVGGPQTSTDANGQYTLMEDAGNYSLQVFAFGYETQNIPVTITAGSAATVNVSLVRSPGGSIAGTVTNQSNGSPLSGATVEVVATPLVRTSPATGMYEFLAVPAGSRSVKASAFGFNSAMANVDVGVGSAYTVNLPLTPAAVLTTFELGTAGWTVTGINGANVGRWELGNPEPTSGGAVQSGDDHTPTPGVNAWITGLTAGASVGTNDVDGGSTILTSPIFSTLGMTSPRVNFWRWYVTGAAGNPTTDFFTTELSTNGGASWSVLENSEASAPAWVNHDFSLGAPSGLVQFRFTARDTAAGSIVEAGLDDFFIYGTTLHSATDARVVTPTTKHFEFNQVRPNPFRAGEATTLRFSLPESRRVEVAVFDVAGRRVAQLMRGEAEAGAHEVQWNGRNSSGESAPAGVYFVRVRAGSEEITQKTMLLR